MYWKLSNTHVDQIDKILFSIASKSGSKGELEQLAVLFRQRFLGALRRILQQALPPPVKGVRVEVDVQVGWIDKIPLADFGHPSGRVELGDALVLAFSHFRDLRTGDIRSIKARGVVLQAKVTNDQNQLLAPSVPIDHRGNRQSGSSTQKELSFLSTWSLFDLYQTSRNKTPLVKDMDINPQVLQPPPYGWYIAAPKAKPPTKSIKSVWPSWWMAGAAENSSPCDVSFGSLIRCFLSGSPASTGGRQVSIGEDFVWNNSYTHRLASYDWTHLCHELLKLLPKYKLPPSIFGQDDRRHSIFGRSRSIYLDRNLSFIDFLLDQVPLIGGIRGRRFPVLIISQRLSE